MIVSLAVSRKLMPLNQLTKKGEKKRWYSLNYLHSMLSSAVVLHSINIPADVTCSLIVIWDDFFKIFHFAGIVEEVSMCTREGWF